MWILNNFNIYESQTDLLMQILRILLMILLHY